MKGVSRKAKATAPTKLVPPSGGVAIRMYRIGHGDCFLLAFDGKDRPVFVLIDCGYKPGSPGFVHTLPNDVVADIKRVTNSNIDVVVITHEHQDHVNAITRARFNGIAIHQVWFAWTESATDPLAKRLRQKHGDTLKALAVAQKRLTATNALAARSLAKYLALEIGGEQISASPLALLGASSGWTNKDAMKLLRDNPAAKVRLFFPHQDVSILPGTTDVRVFALGPPYDETLIGDLNPRSDESFPANEHAYVTHASFAAALGVGQGGAPNGQPFSPRRSIPIRDLKGEPEVFAWYERYYGTRKATPSPSDEVVDNAAFRRIETDWLQAAEHLALAMGNDTNNSSLVLAFELGRGGKVLLFAGDAQRGNWVSWASKAIPDGKDVVDVRELLGRTVLYKVGHHGSHNATLDGSATSPTPNLSWLARGKYADEFTAMITAVRDWAIQPSVGWDHPLPSIKSALVEKCAGRVFQTDTDFAAMSRPAGSSARSWKNFQARASGGTLFFDYRIDPD